MKLSVEQSETLPFPVGCPVWYNSPGKLGSDVETTKEPPTLKQGVVESVSFVHGAKDLVYEVVYEDAEKGTIVEEVSEQNLAYAANCPVTIGGDGGSLEGTILLCKPSAADSSKFIYTVMMVMEGSRARFEHGIDATRVKYRREKKDTTPVTPDAAQKESLSASNNDHPVAKISAVHGDEVVPSSITYDSVANSICSKDEGSNKRARAHDSAPFLQDSGRSITSYNQDGVGSSKAMIDPGVRGHNCRMDLSMPLWLQKDRQSQRNLFFHLIGSKRENRKGVNDIGREANCRINVNFNTSVPLADQPPITITIDAFSSRFAQKGHLIAREQIQCLLLNYMDMHRDGSKGRLIYEVALSCRGGHRPNNSSSRALTAKNPFAEDDEREVFMSVVELPFTTEHGRKKFHAPYLRDSRLLDRIWKETNCSIRVCGDDFDVPTQYCDPYVFVFGKSYKNRHQDVDRAVEIVKEAINS